MNADNAVVAESGLPWRRAVAFIILLGTINLFADMTDEGAGDHRPLSRRAGVVTASTALQAAALRVLHWLTCRRAGSSA